MKNEVERRLFVAATNQNDGKTTCSLGFVKGFADVSTSVGFIKPVGQRYVHVDGQLIDEDALLIKQTCGLNYDIKNTNPVAVKHDFTRKYIDNPTNEHGPMQQKIQDAFKVAAQDNDLVVIEGTGHAGVGAVFDMSNARVAKLLGAKAVIITLGGIGRPVDEVAVNRSLFLQEQVPVLGVVVNKVIPEKVEQTKHYLSKSFERTGLKLFGVIPFSPRLSWPTVSEVAEGIHAEVVNGQDRLRNSIADIIIGAMTAYNVVLYVQDKTLLIVPGDRDDVVLAVVTADLLRKDMELAGIVLTGGMQPQKSTMDLVSRTDIPVLMTTDRTYEVASRVHDLTVKIQVSDQEKTQLAAQLVREHVDLEGLWAALDSKQS